MKLATCGSNGSFELGTGVESKPVTRPTEAVVMPDNIEEVVAAYHFTLARLADGTLCGVGGQINGELGDGTNHSADQPVSPLGISGVKQIEAGGAWVIALHDDGHPSVWGVVVPDGRSPISEQNGTNKPVHLPITDIVAVGAGGANGFAIVADGRLLAWGSNRYGQVGDGTKEDRFVPTPLALDEVVAVDAGGTATITGHALALLSSGKVLAWGHNRVGQCGVAPADTVTVLQPTEVPGIDNAVAVIAGLTSSFAILSDGTLLGWGAVSMATPSYVPTPLLGNVTAAAAGTRQVLAVVDGQVLGMGRNDQGELGDGTRDDKADFTEAQGIEDVRSLSIGGADGVQHTAFLHGGELATEVPVIAEPLPGALALSWAWPTTTKPWALKWRLLTYPKSEWTHLGQTLPADTREFTLTGLESGKRYEVWVQNGDFGWTIVRGTPL